MVVQVIINSIGPLPADFDWGTLGQRGRARARPLCLSASHERGARTFDAGLQIPPVNHAASASQRPLAIPPVVSDCASERAGRRGDHGERRVLDQRQEEVSAALSGWLAK